MQICDLIDNLLLDNKLQTSEVISVFRFLFNQSPLFYRKTDILAAISRREDQDKWLGHLIKYVRQYNKNLKIPQVVRELPLCDSCGTGGDGKHTFNISTISALVAASSGAFIAKHGNRSLTSRCGSSDLLTALGINIHMSYQRILRTLIKTRFAYFHAPNYLSYFRRIQPVRLQLGQQRIKTVFNFAGPLLNPLHVRRQITGVYNRNLIPIILKTLRSSGATHALVFSGRDGIDELTTYQRSYVGELKNGTMTYYELNPAGIARFQRSNLRSIQGGSVHENAKIALNVLCGKDRSARYDTVLLNAAAILYVAGLAGNLREGFVRAKFAIDHGLSAATLRNIVG